MWHALGLTHVHFKKNLKFLKKFKTKLKKNKIKIQKKPRSDTWQSLFMPVNDLNGVSKKGPN